MKVNVILLNFIWVGGISKNSNLLNISEFVVLGDSLKLEHCKGLQRMDRIYMADGTKAILRRCSGPLISLALNAVFPSDGLIRTNVEKKVR